MTKLQPDSYKIDQLCDNLSTSLVICNCKDKCQQSCSDKHYLPHAKTKICGITLCKLYHDFYRSTKCLPIEEIKNRI